MPRLDALGSRSVTSRRHQNEVQAGLERKDPFRTMETAVEIYNVTAKTGREIFQIHGRMKQ